MVARKENVLTRLMSARLRNTAKRFLQFTGKLLTPYIMVNPYLTGKLYPFGGASNEYVVVGPDPTATERDSDGLPIPPKTLRLGEGGTEWFLSSGARDVQSMLTIIKEAALSFEEFSTILEYGCSSGRMIRCLATYAKDREIWGVDLASEHISWNQQYLSPPFLFATISSSPHLPFEDNYFDFIYAGSVFTHIDDLADACFLEIRRILKQRGTLYVTILDSNTLDIMNKNPHQEPFYGLILKSRSYRRFIENNGKIFSVGRSLMSYVFYDTEYLVRHLGGLFDVVSVTKGAYGYQTGFLLRKR